MYVPYFMRLSNGVIVPYGNWADLEANAARGFGCSVETLRREVAWRMSASDDWVPTPGLVANAGLFCGLWTHARRPYPYPCEARVRRHTARIFLPLERWKADLPDEPGGDFQ
jgi:hypothetical protein